MSAVESLPYQPFSVTVVADRRQVVMVPQGELDLSAVDELDREVRELRGGGFDQIVVDLRGLEFLDPSGLRLLLSLRNDAKRDGHSLELVPGPSPVQRIFELTATSSLFEWRDS